MKTLTWNGVVGVVVSLVLTAMATAQVESLDRAPSGRVELASADCAECAAGGEVIVDQGVYCDSGTCGGTVWGSQCMTSCCGNRIGLFPPCPNPCGGTYLGDKLIQAKHGLDRGIKGIFSKLLGSHCCNVCGYSDCTGGCEMVYSDTECGCSECTSALQAGDHPTPAVDMTQPAPPQAPAATDPFTDDSAAVGTGYRHRSAQRTPLPPSNHRVRRASYQEVERGGLLDRGLRGSGKAVKELFRPNASTPRSSRFVPHRGNVSLDRRGIHSARRRTASRMRSVSSGPAPQRASKNDSDATLRFVD